MAPLTGYDYFLANALKYGWMIPSGLIGMFSGLIANIPSGWVLCNGSNSTPDLRDKFVVGARQDDAGVAKTNITGSLTQSGGALGHTHTFTGDGHFHTMTDYISTADGVDDEGWAVSMPSDTESAIGTTDTENALPPYYALAFIMKT